jgi:hypothetical protein
VLLDPGPLIDARDYSMTVETADILGVPIGPAGEVPFWVFVPTTYEKAKLPAGGVPERGFPTRDDPSRTMVVVKPPKGCLRVLDPERPELWPANRVAASRAAATDPARVIGDAPAVPGREPALGPEPEHGWCHAYETIELALSRGDLAGARSIADDALRAQLGPEVGEEWIAVAEALLRTGDPSRAATLLTTAVLTDAGAAGPVCRFTARVGTDTTTFDDAARRAVADVCPHR